MVDDEPAWLRSLAVSLERHCGITNVVRCIDSTLVMDILAQQEIGVVLLDLNMSHSPGEELLQAIVEEHPGIPVIVVTGMNQLETTVRCMKLGAYNYFVKTGEESRLVNGVLHAVKMVELQRENRDIRDRFLSGTLENPSAFAEITTCDRAMRAVFQYVEAVADSPHPVLITGESGVGKELLSRALHALSRHSGQLVAVNVAGLDDSVFADTLFGHLRGSFTGANEARSGLIEQAADGTLFLDEIGDLSTVSQVKLLRLLQEGEYFPLGSDRPRYLRARIVITTHRNLHELQSEGGFRKDLYFRLCTHHVHIPPLRARRDDIPLLLDHFLGEAAEELGKKKPPLPKELVPLLASYSFPGNIRELKSMVYDAMSRHRQGVLSLNPFQESMERAETGMQTLQTQVIHGCTPFSTFDHLPTIQQATATLVTEALRRASGNQTVAARLLGISQPALSKRLKAASQ